MNILLLIITLFSSCKEKPKALTNKTISETISVYCFRQGINDITYRIENHSPTSIYVPINYSIQFYGVADTLYFESIYKKQYSERTYYYYNQNGKTYKVSGKIPGLKEDSVRKETSTVSYNQFIAPQFLEIKPGAFLINSQRLNIPLGVNKAVFIVYKTKYKGQNSYEEYIKYEKVESRNITANIYDVKK